MPDDQGRHPIHSASLSNCAPAVSALLKAKVNPNILDATGNTPTIIAASSGATDTLKVLIAKGGKINFTSSKGNSPLAAAVMFNHIPNVELLLKKGANPNIKVPGGATLMQIAQNKGNASIIKFLQDAIKGKLPR